MPDTLDFAFVAVFTIGLTLFQHYVGWPRLRRRIAAGAPGARLRVYRTVVAAQWTAAIVAWLLLRRHDGGARTIWLVAPTRIGLVYGAVVVLFTATILALQYRSVVRLPADRREVLRTRLGGTALVLPRDARDLRWFMLLSLTAGICEELVYRGYALWVLGSVMSFAAAGLVLTILFGLGHGYQGRSGALRATILGAVFLGMLMLTRSLIPAIVLHVLLDIGGGFTGWAVLRTRDAGTLAWGARG